MRPTWGRNSRTGFNLATAARILTTASGHFSWPLALIAKRPPSGFGTPRGKKLARPFACVDDGWAGLGCEAG